MVRPNRSVGMWRLRAGPSRPVALGLAGIVAAQGDVQCSSISLRSRPLAFAALTFSDGAGRAATIPRIDVPHPSDITGVRFGGHGFGGGGFGHFGGVVSGTSVVWFSPLRPPPRVYRSHRPLFVHHFRRHVFVRRAFFVRGPCLLRLWWWMCVVAPPRARHRKSVLVTTLPLVPRLVKI
jgi:hypothetical protein